MITAETPSSCEETLDEPIPHQDTIAMLHCKVVAPLPSKWKLSIVGDTAMLLESLGTESSLNSK